MNTTGKWQIDLGVCHTRYLDREIDEAAERIAAVGVEARRRLDEIERVRRYAKPEWYRSKAGDIATLEAVEQRAALFVDAIVQAGKEEPDGQGGQETSAAV